MHYKQITGSIAASLTIFFTTVFPLFAAAQGQLCSQVLLSSQQQGAEFKLVAKDNPLLRSPNRELSQNEITTRSTQFLIKKMRTEMEAHGGIGIAAPQIGVNEKVIIAKDPKPFGKPEYVLINPKLTPMTSETNWNVEGCLSVPGSCGLVKRFNDVRVEYDDEAGQHQALEAHGMFARVLQHEIDHLNGILYTDKTLIKEAQSAQAQKRARKIYENHIQEFSKLVDNSVEESFDPYSLSYDIRSLSQTPEDFKADIESLLQANLDSENSQMRGEAFNKWARTEEHALFLYDLMNRAGLAKFSEEFEYLHQHNVYFIESQKSEGGLITYSFEKEGNTNDISLLFRLPSIPENVWMQLPEEERIKQLKNARIPLKTFTKASLIMPTELKPSAVGGYSEELSDHLRKGYGWEISHKKYEINRQRLMREVRDLSKLFKQTHSFQVHMVFELPKNYSKYPNFIYWFKKLNDYLYLKGLEEGLHGNYLTGVANIAADMSWGEKIKNWLRGFYTTGNTIHESQASLGKQNSKFFSAGLRANMYGKASSEENMKIGIELRDTTRKMELLEQYTDKLAKSIEAKNWEHGDLTEIQNSTLRLTTDRPTARDSISNIVSPEYANLFAKIEPTVHFGLIKYEDSTIYDYKAKDFVNVTGETRARLQQARAVYEHDLVALEKELRDLKIKGEKTDDEIIKIAIRMSLSTWAKSARASELFEGI